MYCAVHRTPELSGFSPMSCSPLRTTKQVDHRFDSVTAADLKRSLSSKWSSAPAGALAATVAEMDFGMAPEVSSVLRNAVDQGQIGYIPPALVSEVIEAAAGWCRSRYGWDPQPSNMRVVADVLSGFERSIELFTRPGGSVIVPVPAYAPLLSIPRALGRRVIEVAIEDISGEAKLPLEAISRAFDSGAELFVLCNPHNPLGTVYKVDELRELGQVVDLAGGRVFSDEIHAPLVYRPDRHVPYASTSVAAADHTITAMSASKAWNFAALKCAQIVLGNPRDCDVWDASSILTEQRASLLGAVSNVAAYSDGHCWLDDVVDYLDGSRELLRVLLEEHLDGVRYRPPRGSYLGWIDFRPIHLTDVGPFFAARANVALVDGRQFGGKAYSGYGRLNFATPRPILRSMVEAMGTTIDQRKIDEGNLNHDA